MDRGRILDFGGVLGLLTWVQGLVSLGGLVRALLLTAVLGVAGVWVYGLLMRAADKVKPERMPVIRMGLSLVVGIGAYFTIAMMLGPVPGVGNALRNVGWMIPGMAGMSLAGAAAARRVGETLHCPRCEYEYKFDDDANAPIRCPECGSTWLGMLKKGRKVRSWRLAVAGGAFAIASLLVMNPIFYMSYLAPHLPTPVLGASLFLAPGNAYAVWGELEKRPLSGWWMSTLAERALVLRASNQYDNGPSAWMEAMNTAGKLPATATERYYREGLVAELVVPAKVKVGESFEARVRVKHVANGWGTQNGVMFGGYRVGDATQAVGRQNATTWAHELRPRVFANYTEMFAQTVTAKERGELRVKVEYWVVYLPSFMETLEWQADGTPEKPPTALWFERRELEGVVKVE